MANELPPLVQRVEADLSGLERGLDRAGQKVEQFGRDGAKAGERAARGFERALDTVNSNARLSANQLQNLSYQANDVFTSLASGAPALQVLAQQGGQVYQALADTPGGATAGVRDLGARFLALLTPARLVAGGMVSIGAAATLLGVRWDSAQDKIELGLSGVGKASGATVRQINEISEAAAASGRITASAAREAATAIAATGKVDASNIPAVLNLAPGYAKLFGKDMAEAGTDLAKIFSDPAKGADELNSRLGILDDRTRQYIRTLVAQGDRQGAIRTLAQLAQPELDRAASKTSVWARAWNSVEAAADAAGKAVVRATTGGTLDDRVQETERRRAAAATAAEQSGNVNPTDPNYVAELRDRGLSEAQIRQEVNPVAPGAVDDAKALAKALGDATLQAEDLNEQRRRQGAQGFNDTENALARERSINAGETARAYNAEGEAIDGLQKRLKNLQDTMGSNRARGMLENAEQAQASVDGLKERIALLRQEYAAGGAAAAAAIRAADFQKAVAGLSPYARGLAEINRQFDEMRINAIKTNDLQSLPQTLRANEENRAKAIEGFNRETQDRARSQISIPSDYYGLIRSAESSGNDRAVSFTGAVGRYQFTGDTWLELFEKEKDARFAEIAAKYPDPKGADRGKVRADVLALRTDPDLQEEMVRALTQRNAARLDREGFAATSRNLYLAHNIGPGGASALLRAEREGRGGASAQGLLDPIDPRLVSSNRAYYAGKTVDEALATVDAKTRAGSATSRAQQDRARTLDAEAAAAGKDAVQRERLASVEEQLTQARNAGLQVAERFKTADELLKNGTVGLTGELKAQTEEIIRNSNIRAASARNKQQADFSLDLRDQYAALGRTPGEQQDYLTARRFGAEGTDEFKRAYSQLQELRDTVTLKSDTGSFLKGINNDLQRGATLAEAFRNQLTSLLAKLGDRAIDSVLNGLFGGGTSNSGGDFLAKAGSFLSSIFGGGPVKAATGGRVVGAGSSTSDSIPALLSNGEFVVNARAAQQHPELLSAINGGRVRRFADGGAVTPMVGAMPVPAMARPAGVGAFGGVTIGGDTINITSAQGVTPQQMLVALAQRDQQFRRNINGIVADGRRRYRPA